MDYFLHVLTLVAIYSMLSVSLNLICGYTGILSITHAALFGIGAYVAALLALDLHTSFLVGLVAAAIGAGLIGLIVGMLTLRVHYDYFVIASFAVQVVVFSVMKNWTHVTGGPMGLPGIPKPTMFGLAISSPVALLVLTMGVVLLAMLFAYRLVRSPFGRVLKAIREDELFAQSLGKNVARHKLQVFAIGAALAGLAGAMYAHYVTFIDPSSFTVLESIFILAIVIVGGSGTISGSIVGATLLVVAPEVLRFLGLPSAVAANIRQMLYGLLLIVCMMFRPQGIFGEFAFRGR